MKKNLSKLLSLSLALVMAAGLSAGCIVINTPPAEPTEAPASPEAESTEIPAEPTPTPVPATPEPTEEPAGNVNTLYLKPPYVHGMDMVSIETDEKGLYSARYMYSPVNEYIVFLDCLCIEGEIPAEDEMESYIMTALGDEDSEHDMSCYNDSFIWIPKDYPCWSFSYLDGGAEDTCNVDGLVVFADGYAYFAAFNLDADFYDMEEYGINWAVETCSFGSIPETVVEYPSNTQVLQLPEIKGLKADSSDSSPDGIYSYTLSNNMVSFVSFCHPAAAADIPDEITDPENELPGIIASVYQEFTPDCIHDFSTDELDSVITTEGESCRCFRLSYGVDAYGSEEYAESVMVISRDFIYIIQSYSYDENLDEWFSQVYFTEFVG